MRLLQFVGVCLLGFLVAGCESGNEPAVDPTGRDARILPGGVAIEQFARDLDELVARTHSSVWTSESLPIQSEDWGWELGMVSWVAADDDGLIYLLHRGDVGPSVVVIDESGHKVHAWGEGMYETAHSIRLDSDGHVWTTDSGNSKVLKFSRTGDLLLEIDVGGMPQDCRSAFCGVTDVAFGPGGEVYVSDGYRNARVLEYTRDGELVREWGKHGVGEGEFNLLHSITYYDGRIFVADRENGRVQWFDTEGQFMGESPIGKVFSLAVSGGWIWASTQHLHQPNLSPGWIMQLDPVTGGVEGHFGATGGHGFHVVQGRGVILAPGPEFIPQRLVRMD